LVENSKEAQMVKPSLHVALGGNANCDETNGTLLGNLS
jgi:hypothetical protein